MVFALRWVFCTDIRTDSDFCFIHHWLIGFYNRGGKCLLRGTNWVFKRLTDFPNQLLFKRRSGNWVRRNTSYLKQAFIVQLLRINLIFVRWRSFSKDKGFFSSRKLKLFFRVFQLSISITVLPKWFTGHEYPTFQITRDSFDHLYISRGTCQTIRLL
jgi:hypothetical protein